MGLDHADSYTLTVARMDSLGAEMATLPADTMGGIRAKLGAMAVPILSDHDGAHGLALSMCRDLRRLQTMGELS